MDSRNKLITLNGLTLPPDTGRDHALPDCEIRSGSCTVISGPNGSGKTYYSRVLAGEILPVHGERREHTDLTGKVGIVSFDTGLQLIEAEKHRDESDLNGGAPDLGRPVRKYLGLDEREPDAEQARLLHRFRLDGLLDRGLRALSSGELRKAMILKNLLSRPLLLILDDPFDGLDIDARHELTELLRHLLDHCALVIVTGRHRDAPAFTDTLLLLEAPEQPESEAAGVGAGGVDHHAEELWEKLRRENGREPLGYDSDSLIEMKGIDISYRDTRILSDVRWRVLKDEAWKISGPNGAGKTTLLELISGDNPKAYGQELYLFGRRKGTGETIWDIKQRIGHVSPALHMRQLMRSPVLDVLVSGFFDTLGLYDQPKPAHLEEAREWASLFGLRGVLKKQMRQVSFGTQRVALIVRSLIKRPELILLDEPCHGLDDHNTGVVLEAAQAIAEKRLATLLYVSHDPEHRVPAITHHLRLQPHPAGGYTAETETLGTGGNS